MTIVDSSPKSDDYLAARLDAVVDVAISQKRLVGAVVIAMRDGERVYERTAGLSDREGNKPMTSDAIFRLASVTKPIVTAAAMRLVEDGRIGLDDPVTLWLPDFRPRLADGAQPEIRLRHLLSHTAGLSYRFLQPAGSAYHTLDISDGLDQPKLSIDQNLARLARAPLDYAPGSGWGYSLATDVLGAALEKASGTSLPELVRRLVTGPLGMDDTTFGVVDPDRLVVPYADGTPEPAQIVDGTAVPLWDGAVRFAPSRVLDAEAYPSGGTGMAGTAGEILQFLEVMRTGGAPILGARTVETMMTDQAGPEAASQGPGWGFGFGWAVLVDPEAAGTPFSKGTVQWGGAYGHNWFIDRTQGVSVVMLTNTTFEGMVGTFPREVRDAVYG